MTLVETTYRLQSPPTRDQLYKLGQFANTYGLRNFHVDDSGNHITFEYDASRLKGTEITHVLRSAGISVLSRSQD